MNCVDKSNISECRHFEYEHADAIIRRLIQVKICDIYPCVVSMSTNDACDKSFVRYIASDRPRTAPAMRGEISTQELVVNTDSDGRVRDVDLVWAAKHVMHEARHLYQMRELYQRVPLTGLQLDMARMDGIAATFRGYHNSVYGYTPSEVDADIYGFEDTVKYFDTYVVNGRGELIIDARACLVQRVREMERWRGDRDAPDYESMVQSLRDKMTEYRWRPRPVVLGPGDDFATRRLAACPGWLDTLNDGRKVGVERDEELFSMALDVNPSWIDRHRGLDAEACRVRKLYPGRLSVLGRVDNAIVRGFGKLDSDAPPKSLESRPSVRAAIAAAEAVSDPEDESEVEY